MTGRRKSPRTGRMLRTRRRLSDEETRAAVRAEFKTAYEAGTSIRQLAVAHRLAFGTVRTLLLEAGVVLRTRGGPNHVRRQPNASEEPPEKGR